MSNTEYRLSPNNVISYTYHADGTRATKTTPTEYITFQYNGGMWCQTHMQASNHSVILKTVYLQPHRIIIDPGSRGGGDQVTYYLITDSMGSCMGLMDTSGSVVASYQRGPFGERISNSAPTIYNPVSYAGLYWDSETDLYYANSRYYDPVTARFTTKDSYRGEMKSPISQNRYI